MGSLNNASNKAPIRLLLPPNEISSAKNGSHLLKRLIKWAA